MTFEDRLRDALRRDAAAWQPRDAADAIAARVVARRRTRMARRIATPIALAVAAVIAVPLLLSSGGRSQHVVTTNPPTTTILSTPTTVVPTAAKPTTTTTPTATTAQPGPAPISPTSVVGATPATTAPGSPTPVLSGVIVNQQGQPLAGAAIYSAFTNQLVRTDSQGRFSINCAAQPATPGEVSDDFLWAASWLPNMWFNVNGPPHPVQGAAPADPTSGWTYVNLANTFIDDYQDAPVCSKLQSPARIVLPAAGTIHITGDWGPGTVVSLYHPGLSPDQVQTVLAPWNQNHGDPAWQIQNATNNFNAPWNLYATDNGSGVSFPALSPSNYSVWVGGTLISDCADITVVATQTTDVSCHLQQSQATTTTTATPTTS